jgi:tetratricopeptide (TPR) repeat protein
VFCGCNSSNETGTVEPLSPAQERAQLLAKLEQKFDDPATHVKVGRSFQAERLYDKAEWHYQNAHSFDPVYWPAQAAIVKLLQVKSQNSEADVAAELFKAKVARSVKNSLALGDAFKEARVDDYALACYAQALRLDSKSPEAHKKLGFYYFDKGDKVRAKEYFKQSYNLDWNQPEVAEKLGELGVPIELQTRNRSRNTAPGG